MTHKTEIHDAAGAFVRGLGGKPYPEQTGILKAELQHTADMADAIIRLYEAGDKAGARTMARSLVKSLRRATREGA